MSFIPISIALLLGAAVVTAVAWGFLRLARLVDGLAEPHDAPHFSAEDALLASEELVAR
jgi:hypothetical protein